MSFAAGEEERMSTCSSVVDGDHSLEPFILAADIKDGEADLLKFSVVLA